MKQTNLTLLILGLVAALVLSLAGLRAAGTPGVAAGRFEYATIRWAGRDNTHVIRPSGDVEFVGPRLRSVRKPDRVDDRAFYLTLVMNALAKEGFEFAGLRDDDVIVRRARVP